MTDKQIIIDGVDVSGCEYYDDLDCYSNRDCCGYPEECKDNPNCYYKQLKRKEQENKDLREDIKDIANLLDLDTGEEYNFGNIELEIKHLKAKEQECEETQKALAKCWIDNGRLKKECEELKKQLEKYKDNEQQEKEMQKLYNKFNGNSLIEKSSPNGN